MKRFLERERGKGLFSPLTKLALIEIVNKTFATNRDSYLVCQLLFFVAFVYVITK